MLFDKQLFRYGRELNTHDGLKILAVSLMLVDHVGWYLLQDNMTCRLFGRAAAPLFFFLVGYSGKVHLSVSLILYGIILSITGGLIGQHFWINILLCFVLIHFSLHYIKLETLSLLTRVMGMAFMIIVNPFIYPYLEYGFLGFMVAYSARSVALQERYASYWLAFTLIIYALNQAMVFGFISQQIKLVILGVIFLGMFFLLKNFKIRPLSASSKLTLVGLFISRYSLSIYFYHLILLQAYYLIHYPTLLTRYFH